MKVLTFAEGKTLKEYVFVKKNLCKFLKDTNYAFKKDS